jgi:hypothetical protein
MTPDTLYAVNCNGATSMALEKKEPDGWRVVWAPLINGCLSPPIIIAPGALLEDTLALWGAQPGRNIGPEFTDTAFGGSYRLIWWNLVFHYDPDRSGFGDTVPTKHRTSNELELGVTR